MTIKFKVVDPWDDAGLAEWHAVYVAAQSFGNPVAAPFRLAEHAAALRTDSTTKTVEIYVGFVGGRAVTSGLIQAS